MSALPDLLASFRDHPEEVPDSIGCCRQTFLSSHFGWLGLCENSVSSCYKKYFKIILEM
jgi:hypothetical protein